MILLTTGDLLELLQVPPNTFHSWCERKIVQPVSGGNGTGNQRQWTLMQAVGFVVADRIRKSESRSSLTFFGSTVKAFGDVSEEWLELHLEAGLRYFVTPVGGKPRLSDDSSALCDVQAAYQTVKAYVEKSVCA